MGVERKCVAKAELVIFMTMIRCVLKRTLSVNRSQAVSAVPVGHFLPTSAAPPRAVFLIGIVSERRPRRCGIHAPKSATRSGRPERPAVRGVRLAVSVDGVGVQPRPVPDHAAFRTDEAVAFANVQRVGHTEPTH